MANARLKVMFAGPHVSFQDAGRFGHMRFGVPASGPMDRLSHAAANVAVGRSADATAIEISMGGLILECTSGAATVAVTGGDFILDHAGDKMAAWSVRTLRKGEKFAIHAGKSGSWAYLSIAGEISAPRWLNHTATHSMSGFGGGQLTNGQEIDIIDAQIIEAREGDIPQPEFINNSKTARVVMGPQDQHFTKDAINAFMNSNYTLTDAYDRMGVRLDGPLLPFGNSLSIPSEPILRGSVQVAGDGIPTLLLADHQTTGGYPKIATVISADLDNLTQLRARDTIKFKAIQPSEAITVVRQHSKHCKEYLEQIAKPRGTFAQRLMNANLISGVALDLNSQT